MLIDIAENVVRVQGLCSLPGWCLRCASCPSAAAWTPAWRRHQNRSGCSSRLAWRRCGRCSRGAGREGQRRARRANAHREKEDVVIQPLRQRHRWLMPILLLIVLMGVMSRCASLRGQAALPRSLLREGTP